MAGTADIKLDFERVGLQGRDNESGALLKAYHSSLTSSCSVYVRGASGTGKSTLVRETLSCLKDTIFVQSKCDKLQGMSKQPYCALARALSELSDLAFAMENADLDRDIALYLVGDGSSFLLKAAPNLQQFIARRQEAVTGDEAVSALASSPLQRGAPTRAEQEELAWSSEKLSVDFREVLSIITTYSAVVLFIDDLQWADRASLDIIQSVQDSTQSNGFLFVAAQSENDDDTTEVKRPIRQRNMDSLLMNGRATQITLKNLSLSCVNMIISSLVRIDTEKTMQLAEVVFQKTQGNIFHVVQLLLWIQKPDMLFYSFATLKWEWDLRNIQCGTDMSGDVVGLVGAAFTSLSEEARLRLKVAACLGNQFDAGTIDAMIDSWNLTSEKQQGVTIEKPRPTTAWDEAFSACLIDLSSGQEGMRYQFSHDQFLRAAYDLIEGEGERLRLHHRIGQFLVKQFNQPDASEAWMLLAAVDQLNKSIPLIIDREEELILVKLNLEAAEKIAERSAFISASVLLKTGLTLLGERKWVDHFELALRMTIKSAKFALCCGDHETCKMSFYEIGIHGRSIEDKLGISLTYLDSVLVQDDKSKALELGFNLLEQLDCSLPKKVGVFRVVRAYSKARKGLKRRSDDDLVTLLPPMADSKIYHKLKVFAAMLAPVWLSDQLELFALIVIRMINLTLSYGATPYTGLAYSCFGVVLAKFSQLDEAKRMGELGSKMLQRFKFIDNCVEVETTFITATALAHLTRPLHDLLDMELKSHDLGFELGNMKVVTGAALFYTTTYYHCGLPLRVMYEDSTKFVGEMKEYNLQQGMAECLLYGQAALNLMGKSVDPLLLQGDAISDLQAVLANDGFETNVRSKQQIYTLIMMQLCFFMGDLKQAKIMADINMAFKDEDFPCFPATIYPFWRSLIYFTLVRQGQTKYRRKAFAQMRIVHGFVKAGIGNCHYMLMLLEAEKAAMLFLRHDCGKKTRKVVSTIGKSARKRDGRCIEIRHMYDNAIKSASRSGFLHGKALANERAGIFAADCGNATMRGWDRSYLTDARDLYAEWGATIKVNQMGQEHASLIGNSDEVTTTSRSSSHIKGRSRFNTTAKARHHTTNCFQLSSGELAGNGFKTRQCAVSKSHQGVRSVQLKKSQLFALPTK